MPYGRNPDHGGVLDHCEKKTTAIDKTLWNQRLTCVEFEASEKVDATWQQRRALQCPHGRNPDHGGNSSRWTFSLVTTKHISNQWILFSWKSRVQCCSDWNFLIFLSWIVSLGNHISNHYFFMKVNRSMPFRMEISDFLDIFCLCETIVIFWAPCPPQECTCNGFLQFKSNFIFVLFCNGTQNRPTSKTVPINTKHCER